MLNLWLGEFKKVRDLVRMTLEAAHLHNSNVYRIMGRVSSLYFTKKFSQAEIFSQALTDPQLGHEELARYVSKESIWPIYEQMNKWPEQRLVDNKLDFQNVCQRKGIPVPSLLGVFTPNPTLTSDGSHKEWKALFERQFPDRFVAKPTLGLKGAGVLLISRQKDFFITQDGEALRSDDLLRRLNTAGSLPMIHSQYRPGDQKVIFQSRLKPHPDLAALCGKDVVQCIRICTALDAAGKPHIVFGFLKIVAGKNCLDTFDKGKLGNLLGFIDQETGAIHRAIGRRPGNAVATYIHRHPDTGIDLVGFLIPQWHQVVDLAKRAAEAFSPLGMIGWDIALTDSGPFVLEGNTTWDPAAPFYSSPKDISRWAQERRALFET